ncbi:MAG: flagellar export chaperone FliS [Oscillospiraceae bacterium]|nr:flagellar export chaperone FliS [Oscillospiraceae bacterium]
MTMKKPQDAYRRQGVLTASPVELIVMLYDGLKKNMLLAQRAITKSHSEAAHTHLMKAQNIVSELMNCLDLSFQISEELMRLYDFILHGLMEANLKKDAASLTDLVEIVDSLRDAWNEINISQKGTGSLALEAEG